METKVASAPPPATTILTLEMDSASQAFFERLRRTHYPASLNLVRAHLTLFHKLPPKNEVIGTIWGAAHRPPFPIRVTGLRSLGRGTAYSLESADLMTLHSELATLFRAELTAQDRQPFRPHIVVQNKVAPAVAQELIARLAEQFVEFEIQAQGLRLSTYRGGPWDDAGLFNFR